MYWDVVEVKPEPDCCLFVQFKDGLAGRVKLRLMTLAGDLSVHRIRCQIDLAWPRDRAVINENPFEKLHIPQRRERAGQFFTPQLHTSRQSVFELDKEAGLGEVCMGTLSN